IEFPPKNLDTLSPIFTPERSQPEPPITRSSTTRPSTSPSHNTASHGRTEVAPPLPVQQPVTMTGPVNPTPEQLAKLRSELDIVQGNVQVMSEMLTEMTPGQEEAGDLELLQELNRTCRAMQQRLLVLLEQVANEEVVGELLRINDDLNNVFIRYDRYERFRQAQSKPAEPPRPAVTAAPVLPPMPTPPQASGGTVAAAAPPPILSSQFFAFSVQTEIKKTTQEPDMAASVTQDDEFDMFAQSRKSTFEESRKAGTSYSDNQQPFDRAIADSLSIEKTKPTLGQAKKADPSAMESIEAWLGEEESKQEGEAETMSSQDFDNFLAQRAAAEGQRTNSVKAGSQRPKQRQMQMENKDDDIFGL
ncbi:TOM1-like protein 2, partial [Exaiptasia diaphana]